MLLNSEHLFQTFIFKQRLLILPFANPQTWLSAYRQTSGWRIAHSLIFCTVSVNRCRGDASLMPNRVLCRRKIHAKLRASPLYSTRLVNIIWFIDFFAYYAVICLPKNILRFIFKVVHVTILKLCFKYKFAKLLKK